MEDPLYGSFSEFYAQRSEPTMASRGDIDGPKLGSQVHLTVKWNQMLWTAGMTLICALTLTVFVFHVVSGDTVLTKNCSISSNMVTLNQAFSYMALALSGISMIIAFVMSAAYSWTWGTTTYIRRTPLLPFAHDIEDLQPYSLEKSGLELDLSQQQLMSGANINLIKGQFLADEHAADQETNDG